MSCVACESEPALSGALCASCESRLCGRTALCPEQIFSTDVPNAPARIIDRWGRLHAIGAPRTVLGRQPGADGIGVAEPSVSRRHARFELEGDEWAVIDLESTNGTFVRGERVVAAAPVRSGDLVVFGEVAFFFVAGATRSATTNTVGSPTTRPAAAPEEDRDETFAGLRSVAVSLVAPSGGGGGVLDVAGTRVQLTLVQFELVRILVERMLSESDRDERVRGFVRSSELCASLSWDTARPDDSHLKQLVRRLRRSLERASVADIVESRHGFGYRLRIVPRLG